jgi:hypothetical protein
VCLSHPFENLDDIDVAEARGRAEAIFSARSLRRRQLDIDRTVEMEPNNDLGGYRFDYRRRKWPITGGAHLVSPTRCGASETMKRYILPAGHLAA